jgi:soluble lytic murein transglycosylase-like protein
VKALPLILLLVVTPAHAPAAAASVPLTPVPAAWARFLGPVEFRPVIARYAAETGVPLYIATGLLWSESGGDSDAVSCSGSLGVWQLNPVWHGYFARTFNGGRPFSERDPVASTRVALRYLASLHHRFGSWSRALEAYKAGPNGRVPKHIRKVCQAIARGEA